MHQSDTNAAQAEYWNGDAGNKWATGQQRLDAMLLEVSAELMRAAAAKPGERAIDIGCGCGDTTIELARNGAIVTGIDISRPMLARARERAPTMDFVEADAAHHAFSPVHDLLFSRFGVMFFADPVAAFTNMRHALKPGGRVAFACWRDWRENDWVRIPLAAVRPHVPPQPPVAPEEPGPFAFASLARLRSILATAGFDAISVRPFDTPMTMGMDLEDAVTQLSTIGPASRLLAGGNPGERQRALDALRAALEPHASKTPIALGGAVWIVTAGA